MNDRQELLLGGCRATPLASYLKGLAVLRLVALQRDRAARGCWRDGCLVLLSDLDRQALLDFFLQQYAPTPVLSPWNGGSGFHPKDNADALQAIAASSDPRLAPYREAMAAARAALADLGITGKPDTKREKPLLLQRCRATFPEAALPWLDATTVLAESGPVFMPLLGTGGNDGRLDFSNNFMQQLLHCLPPAGQTGQSRRSQGDGNGGTRHNLEQALFGTASGELAYSSASLGQFLPGGAGGPNAGSGFEGPSVANPWEYVLTVEGSLCFAGAVSRRLGARRRGRPTFPFTVDASAVGGTNLADADASAGRAEVWLPLWEQLASWAELEHLLAEGRAQWGRRQAGNAVDFAQAAVNLGVDRGITAFQRMGLLLRNGRSYLAVTLDQVKVRAFPGTDLLQEPALVNWVDAVRRQTQTGAAPAAWHRALRRIEDATYALCSAGGAGSAADNRARLRDLLVALAGAEQVVARTAPRLRGPVQPLGPLDHRWLDLCADPSEPEYRLALALAGVQGRGAVGPLRIHLEPVAPVPAGPASRIRWRWDDQNRAEVWSQQSPLGENLAALLRRRVLLAKTHKLDLVPLGSRHPAPLADVYDFLVGVLDDRRLAEWVLALSVVDVAGALPRWYEESTHAPPHLTRAYALLKLLFWPEALRSQVAVFPDASVLQRLAAGDLDAAGRIAVRQLRSRQLPTLLPPDHRGWLAPPHVARRILPALSFPVSDPRGKLREWVLCDARETKGAVMA